MLSPKKKNSLLSLSLRSCVSPSFSSSSFPWLDVSSARRMRDPLMVSIATVTLRTCSSRSVVACCIWRRKSRRLDGAIDQVVFYEYLAYRRDLLCSDTIFTIEMTLPGLAVSAFHRIVRSVRLGRGGMAQRQRQCSASRAHSSLQPRF